jgi:hypothetical protein
VSIQVLSISALAGSGELQASAALLLQKESKDTLSIGCRVGPRAAIDDVEILVSCSYRDSNLNLSAV